MNEKEPGLKKIHTAVMPLVTPKNGNNIVVADFLDLARQSEVGPVGYLNFKAINSKFPNCDFIFITIKAMARAIEDLYEDSRKKPDA